MSKPIAKETKEIVDRRKEIKVRFFSIKEWKKIKQLEKRAKLIKKEKWINDIRKEALEIGLKQIIGGFKAKNIEDIITKINVSILHNQELINQNQKIANLIGFIIGEEDMDKAKKIINGDGSTLPLQLKSQLLDKIIAIHEFEDGNEKK